MVVGGHRWATVRVVEPRSVQFASPPVRSVTLTVYFEALETLQPIHLSALREQWRNEYPATGNLAPLRPHPHAGTVADADAYERPIWPFPYMLFSNADESEAVAIQNDRLIRSWSFSEDEKPYPGYDELSRDLGRRLSDLRAVVNAEIGRELTFTAFECRYGNYLEETDIAKLVVGVVTGWKGDASEARIGAAHYAGLSLHLDDEDIAGLHVQVSLDVDEEDASLEILSRLVQKSDGDNSDVTPLDIAHDAVIDAFVRFTSPEMQERWERVQ